MAGEISKGSLLLAYRFSQRRSAQQPLHSVGIGNSDVALYVVCGKASLLWGSLYVEELSKTQMYMTQ